MEDFQNIVPGSLFNDIKNHIEKNCPRWIKRSWDSSHSEEDSLTGDFFGKFDSQDVNSPVPGWKWDMSYKKLRGRGGDAPENHFGADGIFEIVVFNESSKILFRKAFLFQAKIKKAFPSQTLAQARAMDRIAKNSSVIIVYRENDFHVMESGEYIKNAGTKNCSKWSIAEFITQHFMHCKYGKKGMSYDSESEKILIEERGEIEEYSKDKLKHSVKIKVHKLKT